MTTIAEHQSVLDQTVQDLRHGATTWSTTPLAERIALLERLMPRILDQAEAMTAAAAHANGYPDDSSWAAEDWTNGPWAIAQNTSAYLHVLRRIQAGKTPVPDKAIHERNGRTIVEVFPATTWDTLLLNRFRAEVWMLPGVSADQTKADAASEYRTHPGDPAVALVLGAGNVAAITALDILHKLYAEGHVVVAKMNPVNAYVRPHFEAIFAEFIEHGWLRFVDGGAVEGSYLAHHPGVDEVHVTGSERTHDALVWGDDDQAEQRRRDDTPLLTKPFSTELGGVSPCIVVPGRWSKADYRYQAEHILTSKLNNAGHNCIATQILVLPEDWDGADRLLEEIRGLLGRMPARPDYYPGAQDRVAAAVRAHPDAESYADSDCRFLVPAITDQDDALLQQEVFASTLGVVWLPGADVASFLPAAVEFVNDQLPGTLGATLIIDPGTDRANRAVVARALADLRYGTIGVNVWSAVGFLLGYTP